MLESIFLLRTQVNTNYKQYMLSTGLLCRNLSYLHEVSNGPARWPRGLRRGFADPRLLGRRFRIPPEAGRLSLASVFLLLGRGLCDRSVPPLQVSYIVCVCVCVCVDLCVWSGATTILYPSNEYVERGHNNKERIWNEASRHSDDYHHLSTLKVRTSCVSADQIVSVIYATG